MSVDVSTACVWFLCWCPHNCSSSDSDADSAYLNSVLTICFSLWCWYECRYRLAAALMRHDIHWKIIWKLLSCCERRVWRHWLPVISGWQAVHHVLRNEVLCSSELFASPRVTCSILKLTLVIVLIDVEELGSCICELNKHHILENSSC